MCALKADGKAGTLTTALPEEGVLVLHSEVYVSLTDPEVT